MNKKMIIGMVTTALLATSVVASNGDDNMHHDKNPDGKKCKMMDGKRGQDSQMFVHMITRLDLTPEQRDKVRNIVKDSMKNIPNPNDAFTDTSFDKEKFIKLVQEKKAAELQRKADVLEKVYAVLNASQKKDLKTMLDMQEIMKKSMKNHSKPQRMKDKK